MEAAFSIGATTPSPAALAAVPEGGVGFEEALARSLFLSEEVAPLAPDAMPSEPIIPAAGGSPILSRKTPSTSGGETFPPDVEEAALAPAPVEEEAGAMPEWPHSPFVQEEPDSVRMILPELEPERKEQACSPDSSSEAPVSPLLAPVLLSAAPVVTASRAEMDERAEAPASGREAANPEVALRSAVTAYQSDGRVPVSVEPTVASVAHDSPVDGAATIEAADTQDAPRPLQPQLLSRASSERIVSSPKISEHQGSTPEPMPELMAAPPLRSGQVLAPPPSSLTGLAAPPPIRQVASIAVALAFKSGSSNGFDLSLEPAELGRVMVRVERDGDRHSIQVIAERPETLALLQRDRNELDRGLAEAGLRVEAGGISFSLDAEGAEKQGGGAASRQGGASGGGKTVLPTSEGQPAPPHAARGLLDLHI